MTLILALTASLAHADAPLERSMGPAALGMTWEEARVRGASREKDGGIRHNPPSSAPKFFFATVPNSQTPEHVTDMRLLFRDEERCSRIYWVEVGSTWDELLERGAKMNGRKPLLKNESYADGNHRYARKVAYWIDGATQFAYYSDYENGRPVFHGELISVATGAPKPSKPKPAKAKPAAPNPQEIRLTTPDR